MKKLLFLASITVAQAAFPTGDGSLSFERKHFGLIKMKGHPTIQIGDTTVDNVLMRSATLLLTAGKLAVTAPYMLFKGQFKAAGIYAVTAPTLVVGAAAELITGSLQDIVFHGCNSGMGESAIMNALDLW